MNQKLKNEQEQIPKIYDPRQVEDRWYQEWLEKGYFNADVNPEKKPYIIVIPPPNVTAALHMGHAYNNTIQDIFIRYKRKQGYEALYLPGTDHAGIATQNVVEKELRKQNLTRHDLGREEFVKRVWEWKEKFGNTIIQQLKKMGCSCDWRRERFTMDEDYSHAVREVFIRLFNKGWIYRGKYIINWCPRCSTALSDEEVEHQPTQGNLWHIRYPVKGRKEFITVATTRPETMLGDTAVAVHPEDSRYKKFIGKTVVLPLLNRKIPVIADDQVEQAFGTGAVKVTPAHDPNDFQIGLRHRLPEINIMNEDATLNENAGPYKGMDRFVARKRVIEDLKAQELLVKVEKHAHNVGHCHRCHTIIEPYLSEQWFVRMQQFAELAKAPVLDGHIKLHPEERWIKTYLNWLDNIRDWCISRQLWWGHRIPVYYCTNCQNMIAAHDQPVTCGKCGNSEFRQDENVLDTWFSSWLWPFATLGWPAESDDLNYFYPTDTLVTGPDIIFFWVARMIMAGVEFKNDIPFRDVYLNGIVRDKQGRKMSKSLGNGIDPLDVIENYSADAMRYTIIMLSSEGQDINLGEDDFDMGRNFSNKIWNAYRFLAMNLDEPKDNYQDYEAHYELADRWILSRLNSAIEGVSRNLDNFRINDAMIAIYHFFWDNFCDWYLELIKPRLYAPEKPEDRETARTVATHVMKSCMSLLHPFIPFITEEIWQRLKNPEEPSVVISVWPEIRRQLDNPDAEANMKFLQDVIGAIRTIRAEMNVSPAIKASMVYRTRNETAQALIETHANYIRHLGRVEDIRAALPDFNLKSAVAVLENVEFLIPLEGLIDMEAERSRLEKEINRLSGQISGLERKLSNEDFLEKAPDHVVTAEKAKLKTFTEKLSKIKLNLDRVKD